MWSAGTLIITDEQVEIALKNGLSRDTVRNRVDNLNWSIERAISKPLRSKSRTTHTITKQDIAEAEVNGIEFSTFYARAVTYKWPVDEAKSKPLQYKRSDYKMDWNRKIEGLQKELSSFEYNNPSAVLLKRQIKRLEINAKDFNES